MSAATNIEWCDSTLTKLKKLRLTDVGGRKEHPCETVQSALKRGLGGLYDDEAVTYILRHGVRYYLDAARPNAEAQARGARSEAEGDTSPGAPGWAQEGGE